MIDTSKKVRWVVTAISAWTVIQTLIHIFWVLYAYLLSFCWIKPGYYDVVFIYLTYLYKRSCGSIHLKNDTLFLKKPAPDDDVQFPNETSSNVLYQFLNDTLDNAQLPNQSSVLNRTELYLFLLFIADLLWCVTALWLSVGVYCKIKQKCLSIVFYGPWLVCSAFVNFLDVVSSVQYGIDLISIRSYTTWLEFIGVLNYDDFQSFNEHPSSSVIPTIPTVIVIALLARVFIVWLVNVVCFFVILFLAIPDVFPSAIVQPGLRSNAVTSGNELNHNSSEERIKNWQLFYGAVEANSTRASNSSGTSAEPCSSGHNTNTKSKKVLIPESDDDEDDSTCDVSSIDGGFKRFSDVPRLTVTDTNNANIPILKGHIPWSYINPEGLSRQHSYNVSKVATTEERLKNRTKF